MVGADPIRVNLKLSRNETSDNSHCIAFVDSLLSVAASGDKLENLKKEIIEFSQSFVRVTLKPQCAHLRRTCYLCSPHKKYKNFGAFSYS